MKTVIVLVSFIVLTHEARIMNAPVYVPGTNYQQMTPGINYQQMTPVMQPNGQVIPAEVIATPQGYAEVIPVVPVAPVNSQFSQRGTSMFVTSPGMNPVVGTAPMVEVVPAVNPRRRTMRIPSYTEQQLPMDTSFYYY